MTRAVYTFDPTGYEKITVEEFWKKIDEQDEYYLDAWEYSQADIDGKHVWVPTVDKYFELELEEIELRYNELEWEDI